MRKGTIFFIVAALAVVGGYFGGRAVRKNVGDKEAAAPSAVARSADGLDRRKVPISGVPRGPVNAPVTLVVFSDFQCPFCSRVEPALNEVMQKYPREVRMYFRHYPLPMHADAPLASQAALAAEAQGKFWEMHDKLFANQQALKRPDLEKYAQELGLDMGRFKQALDSAAYKGRIDQDMAVGNQVGVNGTPATFVNGRLVSGAAPFPDFKKLIDEEIASTKKLLASGTPADKVYDVVMAGAASGPPPAPAPRPQGPKVSAEVYKVAVGNAPVRGSQQPKVTIVVFSEFQCPFCGRANKTLDQLIKDYPNDVQIAFKHFPLEMHQNAMPAALAAEAAHEQGKFWEMHDKLFANQQSLDRASLEKFAQEIGLDVGKFKAALDASKNKDRVTDDMKQGATFAVQATPTSFINGRQFRGAQPIESWKAVIDEEIKKADLALKGGAPRGGLYAALIAKGLEKATAPPPRPQGGGQPAEGVAYKVDPGNAPAKGVKEPLVTIVQFSDFQCPFCSRVEPTVDRVMKEYEGKVKVVWKDLPLPMHPNAVPAAIAARAAGEQNKFWEMHAKLFANQSALDRPSLEKYAQEIGLNMARFKVALDTSKGKAGVDADAAQAGKLGMSGTPAFFINGVSLVGAQPFENFKARIDTELKKAEALVAKGVKRGKVYDELMKTAKEPGSAAPAGAAAAEAGPEADPKVWKVDPGSAPARGPKNAPVTLVLFSDFQCPFCKRVEPSITQLEREYPGKVRVVWKNYPLPMHQNAKPAAAAALAAEEQGKFWEMHAKLFDNQQQLDRPSLDKYAQELGLDMARFKAALDGNKYEARIAAEMKEGEAVEVTGTPASFINGRKINGAYPYDTFKKVMDQELKKTTPVAAGERRRRG